MNIVPAGGRPLRVGYGGRSRRPTRSRGREQALACAVVGSPDTVRKGIAAFIERHRPDELMLTANIFDHAKRLRSFEIAADVMRS